LLHCDLFMRAAVEFRDVSYCVDGRTILSNFDLVVEEGETLALLGRSGSGKTTALKLINALRYPSAGEIRVAGRPTAEWDVIALRRGIGYVIQDIGLFPHWTVEANVALVPRLQNRDEGTIHRRVIEVLAQVGLPAEEYATRKPHQLSGGQKQRVGVARALAADPKLLLFDEPFGALDPVTRAELQRLFVDLRNRLHKTAVFVTHDVREAMLVGTRIALLAGGALVWLGPAAEFVNATSAEAKAFHAAL
jgi:osmoprotectant transport system ATP-binding protein